jgi:hypothetical protein
MREPETTRLDLRRRICGMNYKIIGSTVAAIGLGATLVALAFVVGDGSETHAVNLAVLVMGLSSGWLVGVLVSPYDRKEAGTFPKYAGMVSVFASGYLISKIDRVLEAVLDPHALLAPVAGFRVIAAVSAFAIALLITYVYREYAA